MCCFEVGASVPSQPWPDTASRPAAVNNFSDRKVHTRLSAPSQARVPPAERSAFGRRLVPAGFHIQVRVCDNLVRWQPADMLEATTFSLGPDI